MKTPEEIKKEIIHCFSDMSCTECPYFDDTIEQCVDKKNKDALSCIEQPENQISTLKGI